MSPKPGSREPGAGNEERVVRSLSHSEFRIPGSQLTS